MSYACFPPDLLTSSLSAAGQGRPPLGKKKAGCRNRMAAEPCARAFLFFFRTRYYFIQGWMRCIISCKNARHC